MTLTFDPLTLKVCGRSRVTYVVIVYSKFETEQSPAELFIIWKQILSAAMIALCPLQVW